MAKKDIYDHIGSTHHFKKRPPEDKDYSWIGGIVAVVFVLFLIGQCTG